ncbi:MAG: porin family protein [Janthinobacterium lividum]
MKKLLMLPLLLGAACSPASAQTGPFHYGIKVGGNLSTYDGGNGGQYSAGYKPSFSAGVVGNYHLAQRLALQVEVLYSQKGVFVDNYRYRYYTPTSPLGVLTTSRYRSTLAYLDVPLLAKVSTGLAGRGLYLEIGPQLSLPLGQREYVATFNDSGSNYAETISTDRSALTPLALGYATGLGYQFGWGLGLGFRYTADFTHVYRDSAGPGSAGIATDTNFHNTVFQLQAQYLFGSN